MALINKKQEYQDQEDWSNDVQKLKEYKEFKEKVEFWAKQKDGFNNPVIDGPYEIIWDEELGWCVDVDGIVSFDGLKIEYIPFQFRNVVSDYFSCCECKNLTSLEGCPIYVDGLFSCSNCPTITSLKGCPKEVGGNFYCYICGKEFTKEYVQSLCKVKGTIVN